MATTTVNAVKISVSLQTDRGPVSAEHSTEVDTISFSKLKIAKGAKGDPTVTPGGNNLHYVVLKSSSYSQVKIKIGAAWEDLDAPIAVLGTAAIKLFGVAPTKFEVDNQSSADIELEIATGWKKAPPPA